MAADKTILKTEKANINLSIADLALVHCVAVTAEGESAGGEQLFAADFNQKTQSPFNAQTHSRDRFLFDVFQK